MTAPLRVATFNVQHGRLTRGRVDVRALATACASLGADVVGLQEVDRRTPRTRFADLARVVGRASGMAHVFGPARRLQVVGRYGNALLARGEIADHDVIALPRLARRERRVVLIARVTIRDDPLTVAVTHLSTDNAEARDQLDGVVEALARRPWPQLLLGDLNLELDAVQPVLAAAGFATLDPPPTFPAWSPRRHLDHIAAAGAGVSEPRAVALGVSDHRALVATLTAR